MGSKSTCDFEGWRPLTEGQESKVSRSMRKHEKTTQVQFLSVPFSSFNFFTLDFTFPKWCQDATSSGNKCLPDVALGYAMLRCSYYFVSETFWNMCRTGGAGLWFPLNSRFSKFLYLSHLSMWHAWHACAIPKLSPSLSLWWDLLLPGCGWVAMFLLQLHTTAHARNLHRILPHSVSLTS